MPTKESNIEEARQMLSNRNATMDNLVFYALSVANDRMMKDFPKINDKKTAMDIFKGENNILKDKYIIGNYDETKKYAEIVAEFSANIDSIADTIEFQESTGELKQLTKEEKLNKLKILKESVEGKFKSSGRLVYGKSDSTEIRGKILLDAKVQEKDKRAEEKNKQAEEKDKQAQENEEKAKNCEGPERQAFTKEAEALRTEAQGFRKESEALRTEVQGFRTKAENFTGEANNLRAEAQGFRTKAKDLRNQINHHVKRPDFVSLDSPKKVNTFKP